MLLRIFLTLGTFYLYFLWAYDFPWRIQKTVPISDSLLIILRGGALMGCVSLLAAIWVYV